MGKEEFNGWQRGAMLVMATGCHLPKILHHSTVHLLKQDLNARSKTGRMMRPLGVPYRPLCSGSLIAAVKTLDAELYLDCVKIQELALSGATRKESPSKLHFSPQ